MQNAQKGNRKGAFFSFFREPLLLSNLDSPASTLGERENGTIFHQHFVFSFSFVIHHQIIVIIIIIIGELDFSTLGCYLFFLLCRILQGASFFVKTPRFVFLVVFPHVPIISWSLLPPFFPKKFRAPASLIWMTQIFRF